MKNIILIVLLFTGCGDTNCSIEEFTQKVNGEYQRCSSFQCPNSPKEITCRK